jgi:ATP-dependent helicase HrpA
MQVRAERAVLKPLKDAERLKSVQAMSSLSPREGQEERFRWMLEEFRVSIFAQELGTSESVSETRLRELAASTAF